MLKEYVKIAFRSLRKDKFGAAVNLFGLTLGITACLLISSYVWIEFTYDRFHPFAERTYRILGTAKFGGNDIVFTGLHESFGAEAKRVIPEVESVVRCYSGPSVSISGSAGDAVNVSNIGFADQSVLQYLGFRLKYGNRINALDKPGEIVLTEDLAIRLFATTDVLGKTVYYNERYPLVVSGVLEKVPSNSIFKFNGIISLSSMNQLGDDNKNLFKGGGFLDTFLILKAKTNPKQTKEKLDLIKAGPQFPDMVPEYQLEKIADLHLFSRSIASTHLNNLKILSGIAAMILLLAIINYISLATARGASRAKEIGIRKIIGGSRLAQIMQLFIEALVISTIAVLISVFLTVSLFPTFKHLLDAPFDVSFFSRIHFYVIVVSIWLVTSVSIGVYPSFSLSAVQPAKILTGKVRRTRAELTLRKVFTLVQYTVSIALILASITIYRQMSYIMNRDLGLSRSKVIAVQVGQEKSPFAKFRADLRQIFGESSIAVCNTTIFTSKVYTSFMETRVQKKGIMVNVLSVDRNFFELFDISWIQRPREFNLHQTSNLTVFNQALAAETNLPTTSDVISNPFDSTQVDGIVSDFYIGSVHRSVAPAIITVVSDTNRTILNSGAVMYIKISDQTSINASIEKIRKIYKSSYVSSPFDYTFVDDLYNSLYVKERQMSSLVTLFSVLSLLIAILGLVGLVTYNVHSRVKEIGIRKALGATTFSILLLFMREFIIVLGIGTLVAVPVSWYSMTVWLRNFSIRIQQEPIYFGLAILGITVLTLGTVLSLTVKSARMNPDESLRIT